MENLRAGAADALQRGLKNLGGLIPVPGSSDPLGRGPQSLTNPLTDGLSIPDASALNRARHILDRLRNRAADPARPATERDYYRRLLAPF